MSQSVLEVLKSLVHSIRPLALHMDVSDGVCPLHATLKLMVRPGVLHSAAMIALPALLTISLLLLKPYLVLLCTNHWTQQFLM